MSCGSRGASRCCAVVTLGWPLMRGSLFLKSGEVGEVEKKSHFLQREQSLKEGGEGEELTNDGVNVSIACTF